MNKKPIREADIKHMLKLQELFHNKFLNQELLNEMVSLYVKAIDCCSDRYNLMKIYFLQKMQFVLSRPQIENLLSEKESEQSTKDKYTIKISTVELNYETPQYVRKSSLRSQPVGKRLVDIIDEDEKIRQRENRIKIQLEMLREIQQLSTNQISLQPVIQTTNYPSQKKKNPSESQGDQFELKEKLINRSKKSRKNSDDFEHKKQLNEVLQGNKIPKNYLIQIHEELNEKLKKMTPKTQQFISIHELSLFKRRKNTFRSTYNDEENEHKSNQHLIKQMESKGIDEGKQGIFYSFSNASFTSGTNTPEFSQKGHTTVNKIQNGFPSPADKKLNFDVNSNQKQNKMPDTTHHDNQKYEQVQSDDEYVEDEYF